MPQEPKALLLWENNNDTPVNSSNLSRMIDVQSDSKFIRYVDDYTSGSEDLQSWADVIISGTWPEGLAISQYVGKVVYNTNDNTVREGALDTQGDEYWKHWSASPYKKMLKLLPFTKVSMKYIDSTSSKIQYENFDSNSEDQLFSIETLLLDDDLFSSSKYFIYAIHDITFGDYCYLRIVREVDDELNTNNWKIGSANTLSPTGHGVVSYRKIGGFETDVNGYILENTLWDISTYNKEIVSESYKIFDGGTQRQLKALDIPIDDISEDLFNSNNVNGALLEAKNLLNSLREDTYDTSSKFGVNLIYSPVKKVGNQLVEIVSKDEISLKITKGYINVLGVRVKIEDDIYISGTTIPIRINNGSYDNVSKFLGQQDAQNTRIYEGLWRCFIDTRGYVSFRHDSISSVVYRANYRGWYEDGVRCIGKFNVRFNSQQNFFYIEKMSVTQTFDENIPTNTVYIFHGTMCPDGLLPCDGRWHDTIGYDKDYYNIMPVVSVDSNWQSGSWYEETPDMWDRTVKQISNQVLPYQVSAFSIDRGEDIVYGGSADTGASNDVSSSSHSHDHNHTHDKGTFNITALDDHTHQPSDITDEGGITDIKEVQESQGTAISVAGDDHNHRLVITGGSHVHSRESFQGNTGIPSVVSTSSASSWSPYKEMIFCIKK